MTTMSPTSLEDNGDRKPSAVARVLGITELAEAILSESKPRDLLVSQRVCKLFREIFQQSTEFKQRLHLLPNDDGDFKTLPLLPDFVKYGASKRLVGADLAATLVCPRESKLYSMKLKSTEDTLEAVDASWRHMQISSPATKTVKINLWARHHSKLKPFESRDWEKTEGFTLGDLADYVMSNGIAEIVEFRFADHGGRL